MNIKTLCSESEQDSLQFTLIVRLWHVLELRLNHARHGGHGLARPRGPHHVSHPSALICGWRCVSKSRAFLGHFGCIKACTANKATPTGLLGPSADWVLCKYKETIVLRLFE